MNNKIDKTEDFVDILTESRNAVSLSTSKKAEIRRFLEVKTAEGSNFRKLKNESPQVFGIRSYFWWRMTAATLVVLIVVGSSASFIAADSLPGEVLYSVKTRFSEPIRLALAPGAKARATLEAEIAVRRLKEMTKLADEGRLSEENVIDLSAKFKHHVRKARAAAIKVDNQKEPYFAADFNSDLEVALGTQEHMLAMARDVEMQLNVQPRLATALRTIKGEREGVTESRVKAEVTISRNLPLVKRKLAQVRAPVSSGIASREKTSRSGGSNMMQIEKSVERVMPVDGGQLEIAEELTKESKRKIAEGDMGGGFLLAQDARRITKSVSMIKEESAQHPRLANRPATASAPATSAISATPVLETASTTVVATSTEAIVIEELVEGQTLSAPSSGAEELKTD